MTYSTAETYKAECQREYSSSAWKTSGGCGTYDLERTILASESLVRPISPIHTFF